MTPDHYTVLGSLPHLPHFRRAERLPLTRLRLEQRIDMLPPDQARQIRMAETLVSVQRTLARREPTTAWVRRWHRILPAITQPALRTYVEYRLEQQLILTALRLHHQRLEPDAEAAVWTLSPLGHHILRHWHEADLGLKHRHPWLETARRHLVQEEARALDEWILEVCWQKLRRIGDHRPLGFGAVVAFVFQWDILEAWLARDAEQATLCFERLMGEIHYDR